MVFTAAANASQPIRWFSEATLVELPELKGEGARLGLL